MSPNVSAFLAMIRHSEGTDLFADPYRVCYSGKHTIADLSDHPFYTGEWKGEPLPDHMCIAAGDRIGCVSTAAGAYQMNHLTWWKLKTRLALASFNSDAQDDAAIEDIKSVGAFALINAGELTKAVQACRQIWASLPGNFAGQPQRSLAELANAYAAAGGALA